MASGSNFGFERDRLVFAEGSSFAKASADTPDEFYLGSAPTNPERAGQVLPSC
jgi:hypothetical protein